MKLENLTVAFLGDSITAGHGVENCEVNRYDSVLKRIAGLKKIENYGLGGTRFAPQDNDIGTDFIAREKDMDKDADVVVVFGATNDYGHGIAPFGSETDTTPDSFCGSVDFLMKTLKKDFPKATIVFMTPCRRSDEEKPDDSSMKLPDAKPLKEYVDIIIRTAKRNGIPVLDLYRELPILDPNKSPEQREMFIPDGLHPSDIGHYQLAIALWNFLNQL